MVAENPTWGAPRIHGELLKLGFNISERKCGDQYFLAEIWDGQSNSGIAIPLSKREKELQMARDTHQPELVVIAMK
jgi:hypothetical protein